MEAPIDKVKRIDEYGISYALDLEFELHLVKSRNKLLLDLISSLRPKVVLEVGCGLTSTLEEMNDTMRDTSFLDTWIIMEPNSMFYESMINRIQPDSRVELINEFIEDSVQQVINQYSPVDLVICSSVLHEVPNLEQVLIALRQIVPQDKTLHVNVPNSHSLHRRLAVSMGLIEQENEMSDRNIELKQCRVFNLTELERIICDAGFEVIESGGYFIKPFTHNQMAELPFLNEELLDGLYRLGRSLPDLAAEIFVNARNNAK